MVWIGMDLTDHVIPTRLPWTGTPSTRPGCSTPHPAWEEEIAGGRLDSPLSSMTLFMQMWARPARGAD